MFATNFLQSAMSIAALRAKYQTSAFPPLDDGRPDPSIKDINSIELQYYGKISPDGLAVYPVGDYMTIINQGSGQFSTNSLRMLPFVKDMILSMRRNIQIKMTLGSVLPTNQAISTMTPVTAFTSPRNQYVQYLRNILASFNLGLSTNDNNNITRFDDYVKKFYVYLSEQDQRTPITFSGWTTSKENSLYTSGLAVSLMGNQYHNDEHNTTFINDLMFPYYKKLAMNKGFCLVKQAPWILIADLNSPAILDFYESGISDANGVFNSYYNFCYLEDLNLLINNLINYYNNLLIIEPEIRKVEVLCNRKTKVTKSERSVILDTEMTYREPRKYFSYYVNMRNMEEGYPLSEFAVKQTIKKAKTFLDTNASVGYINSIFAAELFKKPFGLGDLTRRYDKRVTAEKGIQGTEQQTKQAIGTGTSTFGGSSGGGMSGGGSGGGY